jgi:exodeoxyribonuclease VII large subunit
MIPGAAKAVYSVTSLTRELKNLVEGKYRFVQVKGEISNHKRPYSGHSYFTLKDDGAQLKSVLFKGQSRYLEKELADGQQVVCHGRLSIYEPRGDYQLIVDSVDFQGSGRLQQQFERLKQKLQEEGLFARENKNELPQFPKKVVLLTSPSGAAVHDFLNIWKKRAFPTQVQVYGVPVQGDTAAKEIAKGIEIINVLLPETEIIVLCRGGGSLEDLWAFNEEILARAIANSTIPIVSAVGHEVDFSISDFCSDLRAPTPTAAAETIFPDGKILREHIARYRQTMGRTLLERIEDASYRVLQNRRILGDMDALFSNALLRVDHASHKLLSFMEKRIAHAESGVDEQTMRLQAASPSSRVRLQQQRLQFATDKLLYLCKNILSDKESLLGQQAALLDAVSPLATLGRGYSIARKLTPSSAKKTLLTKSSDVQIHDKIEIRLHQGELECQVSKIK